MTSEVDICNLALGNIRAGSIQSLDTTEGIEAPQCKIRYPQARDVVLGAAWWTFAGKDAPLALLSEEPTEWEYAYAWPSDCLQPRYIIQPSRMRHNADPIEFEVTMLPDGTRVINTDLADACLKYTFKQTDPLMFSASFIESLSWWLAATLAIPVVGTGQRGGRALREEALSIYESTLAGAIATDAERGHQDQRDPDTIEARL